LFLPFYPHSSAPLHTYSSFPTRRSSDLNWLSSVPSLVHRFALWSRTERLRQAVELARNLAAKLQHVFDAHGDGWGTTRRPLVQLGELSVADTNQLPQSFGSVAVFSDQPKQRERLACWRTGSPRI